MSIYFIQITSCVYLLHLRLMVGIGSHNAMHVEATSGMLCAALTAVAVTVGWVVRAIGNVIATILYIVGKSAGWWHAYGERMMS